MIRDKIQEAAEKIYDLVKDGKYDVEINLSYKKKEDNGIKVKVNRSTLHNIKWRAKNH